MRSRRHPDFGRGTYCRPFATLVELCTVTRLLSPALSPEIAIPSLLLDLLIVFLRPVKIHPNTVIGTRAIPAIHAAASSVIVCLHRQRPVEGRTSIRRHHLGRSSALQPVPHADYTASARNPPDLELEILSAAKCGCIMHPLGADHTLEMQNPRTKRGTIFG